MSLAVLTWVFKHSEAKLANRLVLLALADYAHDDGSKAFPSIPTLAAKARVSERTAIRCLQALVKDGAIEQTGKTRGGTKIYKVLMGHDNLSPANLSPDNGGVAGVTSTAAGGDIDGGGLYREPSREPSPEPSAGAGKADAPTPAAHPLCFLLADLLAANGVPEHKRRVTKAWATAERLMRERDKRDPAQMEALLRWGTAHEFWRANLLSMTGFREKYDQIRLQAERDGSPAAGGGARSNADADVERLARMQREAEERERGEA